MAGLVRVACVLGLFAVGACGTGGIPQLQPEANCLELGLPLLQAQNLDFQQRQVFVDVKFVTVSTTRLDEMGVQFPIFAPFTPGALSALGGVNCGPGFGVASSVIGGATGAVALMSEGQMGAVPMANARSIPVQLGLGSQVFTNMPGTADYTIASLLRQSVQGLSPIPQGIQLAPAVLPFNNSLNYLLTNDAGRLQFLNEVQISPTTRVVSVPRILTMDNQQATVFVGTEVPIPNELLPPQRDAVLALDPQIPAVEVGVTMRIEPSVPQTGIVQLEIDAPVFVSAVVQDPFVLNGTLDSAPQVPIMQRREFKTAILLNDGNTAILGGLRDDTTQQVSRGVPVFADLPVVGGLFRSHNQLDLRENLIILLTVNIAESQ